MGIFITSANTGTQLGKIARTVRFYITETLTTKTLNWVMIYSGILNFYFCLINLFDSKNDYITLIAETRSKKNSGSGFYYHDVKHL